VRLATCQTYRAPSNADASLLDAGAEPTDGALSVAATHARGPIVRLLIRRGASVHEHATAVERGERSSLTAAAAAAVAAAEVARAADAAQDEEEAAAAAAAAAKAAAEAQAEAKEEPQDENAAPTEEENDMSASLKEFAQIEAEAEASEKETAATSIQELKAAPDAEKEERPRRSAALSDIGVAEVIEGPIIVTATCHTLSQPALLRLTRVTHLTGDRRADQGGRRRRGGRRQSQQLHLRLRCLRVRRRRKPFALCQRKRWFW